MLWRSARGDGVAAAAGWARRALRWAPQAVALLLLVVLGLGYLQPSTLKNQLANLAFDALQNLRPRTYVPAGVQVLDIDEASLRRYGQWPWPRTVVAEIVERLTALGARSIGFDMVLAEQDRTSPAAMLRRLAVDEPRLVELLPRLADHDDVLAAQLRKSPVVMGFALTAEPGGRAPTRRINVAYQGGDARPFLPWKKGTVLPLDAFESAAPAVATISFEPDIDGVVRRLNLLWAYGEETDPLQRRVFGGLAIESLRLALRYPMFKVLTVRADETLRAGVRPGIVEIQVRDKVVPTDRSGAMWLYYTPHEPKRFLSVVDLMDGTVDPARLRDAIVLVGTSAEGLLDLRFSPFGIMPGVEMHAQAIEQILRGEFLDRPDWAESVELLVMVAVSLLMILLVGRLGALGTALLGGVAVLAGLLGTWWAFTEWRLLFAPIYPWGAITAVYLLCTGIRFFQTEREGRFIRGAFASYISPNLVKHLLEHPDQLRLGGERRDCSFVLTDLAGFTSLVERSEPEQVVALLNAYIEGMTSIAFRHDGTLDRIVGDAVAVMFSAPVVQPDHAARAVACALEMDAFSRRFRRDHTTPERKVGRTRIGVHSGSVIIGNFGGAMFDYRALGDAINTTARLETVNRHLGTRVCVSAAAANQVPGFVGRPVGRLVLKGKSEPIEAFEPLDAARAGSPAIAAYRAAYALLEAGDPGARDALAAIAGEDELAAFHLARLHAGEHGAVVVMDEK